MQRKVSRPLMKRGVFVVALLMLVQRTPTVLSANEPGQALDPRRPLKAELDLSIEDGFVLCAVGDCTILRPLSQLHDDGLQRVLSTLRDAGVTLGNLETTILDVDRFSGHAQAENDGFCLLSAPEVAADLRRMGFDLLSRANNHGLDWGIEGMRECSR